MAITFTDKLRIICYVCKVFSENAFIDAYLDHRVRMKLGEGDRDATRSNRTNWFEGARPSHDTRAILIGMLEHQARNAAPHLGNINDLLNASHTTPQFIEHCRVRFPDLEREKIVSADAVQDWTKRYNGMHFMEKLIEFEEHEDGRKLLEAVLGTYYLYRRHSVLPGILREVVVVNKHRYGHAEGTYYQFSRTEPWNEVNFNVFFAGFYLLAFGAFKTAEKSAANIVVSQPQEKGAQEASPARDTRRMTASQAAAVSVIKEPMSQPIRSRTEILEIKILIENALLGGKVNCEQKVFAGILTGIYDYGNILLAERILVRRISDAKERDGRLLPEQLLPDKESTAKEYYAVLNAIDNSSNGQTLSVRPIHLEKPFLLTELLDPPHALIVADSRHPPMR